METMLFQYATFNGTNLTTITSAGLTTNALIGSWILFPTENYLLSGTSTPNYSGVLAWGRITANDATTITAAVSGAATVPLATDKCLIVQVPRLDFSSDLAETTAVRSFTNNLNVVKFTNSDNKDDLFTKVTVKGKDMYTGKTESVSFAAVTEFDSLTAKFDHSTVITRKTIGYVHSTEDDAVSHSPSNYSYIFLKGWGWALPNISSFDSKYIILQVEPSTGGSTASGGKFMSPVEMVKNGENVTRITSDFPTISNLFGDNDIALYYYSDGTVGGFPLYIKSYSDIGWTTGAAVDQPSLRIGSETYTARAGNTVSAGIDTTFGPFIYCGAPVGANIPYPHYPGCLIWTDSYYSETSPATGSAVEVNGIISKSLVADADTSKVDFEVLACNTLIQGSQYYQKSTVQVSYYQFTENRVRDGVQLTGPAMIREGQRISIVPATGVTAISRQVIGWEFDASTMTFKLTLGDYIKDVYNTINTNTAATQKALI
jgi:hypothetical protein